MKKGGIIAKLNPGSRTEGELLPWLCTDRLIDGQTRLKTLPSVGGWFA